MNRSERLFCLIDLLKSRSFITAAHAAEQLGVSRRTIYRDIQTLTRNGCPIRGEAGVGYRIERIASESPLPLSAIEIEALLVGMRWLESWADAELLDATQNLIRKLRLEASSSTALFIGTAAGVRDRGLIGKIRQCIERGERLNIRYTDAMSQTTNRNITPLGLFYWHSHWTVAAFCELRADYRSFRLDRIESIASRQPRSMQSGISLAQYLERTGLMSRETRVSSA